MPGLLPHVDPDGLLEADYRTFRVGLLCLDKLGNIDRTVGNLRLALDQLC